MRLSKATGIFCPSDLATLQRVFDQVCAESKVAPGSRAGASLAMSLIAHYKRGTIDETALVRAAQTKVPAHRSRNGQTQARAKPPQHCAP